jgi:F-type H+-transporting ATPase subunit epsilon
MSKTFKLQVVAPDKPAIAEDATLVVLPGTVGEFGVMADHMSLMSALKPGTMRILKGQTRDLYFIAGGFAEVHHSSVIVLAEEYERAGEIDGEEVRKAKKRAEEQLAEKKPGTDMEAIQNSLARAEARLKALEEFKASKK